MNPDYNYKAITFFCAAGFFPDKDTYVTGERYSYPSTPFKKAFETFSEFQWHYSPVKISLAAATDKFAEILESIIDRESGNKQVILPLSGGLDSRTLAAALKRTGKKVETYSYSFRNGQDENKYGKTIADIYKFPFHSLIVEPGYLWKKIDQLAGINHCYSEFTHPRQMAFTEQYESMGDIFALGHWGDVLFDDMKVEENMLFDSIKQVIIKKISKRGGADLAKQLWVAWNLEGSFEEYYNEKISQLLQSVHIKGSANATIRAFKSKYWATRWTASNFSIFESAKPITVPYFDDEMCRFVCSLPETLLKGRQIQIEYLKKYAPELAAVPWQAHKPFNLYTYSYNKFPYNLPYRIANKINRTINTYKGTNFIQRNWELQFTGESNKKPLHHILLENHKLNSLIPSEITNKVFRNFYENDAFNSAHPLSMLLTISQYCKLFRS